MKDRLRKIKKEWDSTLPVRYSRMVTDLLQKKQEYQWLRIVDRGD